MTPKQTRVQSHQAYQQHKIMWREHAQAHAKFPMKSFEDLQLVGMGRAVVAVANGFSFEQSIDLLVKYKDNVDFICHDKTLGHLLRHGIKPTYCVVCDSRVNYEKYMEPWKDQLQDTILLQNVCANPKWAQNGNWKDKYFFVNMDVLKSEREFVALSGCKNLVTAGTNVSNMLLVLLTQCTNEIRRNLMGYDKIILVGFDYSWLLDGKYYAFDDDGGGKKFYMRHIYGLSPRGKMLYTSNNMNSSASWAGDYVQMFKIPVVQTNPDSVATFGRVGDLEKNLKYRYKTTDREAIWKSIRRRKHLAEQIKKEDDKLKSISKQHYYSHLSSV